MTDECAIVEEGQSLFTLTDTLQLPLADVFNMKPAVVGDEYAIVEEDPSESSSDGEEEVVMMEAVSRG